MASGITEHPTWETLRRYVVEDLEDWEMQEVQEHLNTDCAECLDIMRRLHRLESLWDGARVPARSHVLAAVRLFFHGRQSLPRLTTSAAAEPLSEQGWRLWRDLGPSPVAARGGPVIPGEDQMVFESGTGPKLTFCVLQNGEVAVTLTNWPADQPPPKLEIERIQDPQAVVGERSALASEQLEWEQADDTDVGPGTVTLNASCRVAGLSDIVCRAGLI